MTLESRRVSWRLLLSALGGGTLALVFGAVSLFMYRENRYVYTLVKSFGLEQRWIFLAVLLENLSIALAGGAIGLAAALSSAKPSTPPWGWVRKLCSLWKTSL